MRSPLGVSAFCCLHKKKSVSTAISRFQDNLPLALFICVSAATLMLWQALRIHQQETIRFRVQQGAANISYAIEHEVQGSIFALERMTNRWEQSGKPERALWEADATLYTKHYGTFQAIAWADPSFQIQWVVPILGNEASQGFNVLSEMRRREAIERAISQRRTVVTRTVTLVQGGKGFLVYVPIFHENQFEGLIIGVFRTQAVLDKVIEGLEKQGSGEYTIQFYDGSDEIYTHHYPDISSNQQWSQSGSVNINGVIWHLKVAPTHELIAKTRSPIAEIILGTGLLLALLLFTIAKLVLITYKQHQQAIAETAKTLAAEKRLNALKSQFITSASHEFRTPLAIISSSTGVLEDYYEKLDISKRQKHLNRIQNAVRQMIQILEDVLMIEKVEKGKLECTPHAVDLMQFYHDLVKEFEQDTTQSRIIVSLATHTETSSPTSSVPDVMLISMDEQLVQQILNNLLSNALKYSPSDSSVFLDIRCQPHVVEFEIRDQGIGIPADDLQEIFTPFHRGGNVGTTLGTGLGLTLVKRCVNLHGGTIAIHSEPGSGTCVTVHIPTP